jgi:hypothetical protein
VGDEDNDAAFPCAFAFVEAVEADAGGDDGVDDDVLMLLLLLMLLLFIVLMLNVGDTFEEEG